MLLELGHRAARLGRFAFYLADVGEDADIVMTILRMIYKLDELSGGGKGDEAGEPGVRLPAAAVRQLQDFVRGYMEKVKVMKAGMNEALRLLDEMNFDVFEKMLLGVDGAPKAHASRPGGASAAQHGAPASGSAVVVGDGKAVVVGNARVAASTVSCAGCGAVCKNEHGMKMHASRYCKNKAVVTRAAASGNA